MPADAAQSAARTEADTALHAEPEEPAEGSPQSMHVASSEVSDISHAAQRNNITKERKNSKLERNINLLDEIKPLGEPAVPAVIAGQGTTASPTDSAGEEEARNLAVRQRLESFKHYPTSARRRGIEGAVDVSFRLNDDGRAEDMQLVSGSGYSILDDAALSTVRRAEPFPVRGGFYQFRLLFTRS